MNELKLDMKLRKVEKKIIANLRKDCGFILKNYVFINI